MVLAVTKGLVFGSKVLISIHKERAESSELETLSRNYMAAAKSESHQKLFILLSSPI